LAGKRIDELDLASEMGVDIIAIRRNKDWIINPKGNERLLHGDVVITRGAPHGIKDFKDFAEGIPSKVEG